MIWWTAISIRGHTIQSRCRLLLRTERKVIAYFSSLKTCEFGNFSNTGVLKVQNLQTSDEIGNSFTIPPIIPMWFEQGDKILVTHNLIIGGSICFDKSNYPLQFDYHAIWTGWDKLVTAHNSKVRDSIRFYKSNQLPNTIRLLWS